MKLSAEIAGERHEVQISTDGPRVFAEIDGRNYHLEAHACGPGVQVLMVDGRVYECRVQAEGGTRSGPTEVLIGSRTFAVTLIDPKRLPRGRTSLGAQADGAAQIIAPMPGKVVRVLVEQGARVEAGDPLIVVEAMKMQNEMKSPRAGTIAQLQVETGATVSAGQVLAVIE